MARSGAREVRQKITEGIDPVSDKQGKRSALIAAQVARMPFREAAAKYIAAQESGWKNPKSSAQWTSSLESYAFPIMGDIGVADIDTPHVVRVIEPIWTTRTETASRLRGRIESILDWATVRGYRKGENPARWRGHLEHLLPARAAVATVEHHPALPFAEVGTFMVELRSAAGTGARALEFGILTAARSGEIRGATWSEIDLAAGVWTIPADRMKAGREHRVPLSAPVLALLNALPRVVGTDLVFPNTKGAALSDMTLTRVLKRMGRPDITGHGFRSTFRDWAGETGTHAREVIEHALAHQLKDAAERAYARGTLFDKRRRLMDDWAQYCNTVLPTSGVVIPLRSAA
jgi:integrase